MLIKKARWARALSTAPCHIDWLIIEMAIYDPAGARF